jgi:uncharacterized membrane protein
MCKLYFNILIEILSYPWVLEGLRHLIIFFISVLVIFLTIIFVNGLLKAWNKKFIGSLCGLLLLFVLICSAIV